MGLGGWLFSGINPHSLMGAFATDGITGFSFRFTHNFEWSLPNPVGIDNYFEGLCLSCYADMHSAAARFAATKFGPGGACDPARPGPFRDSFAVKARIERYKPQFVELLGVAAQYLHDIYGKFPASNPTFFARIYAQAHHADIDFCDLHYGPGFYLATHRQHMAEWHGRF